MFTLMLIPVVETDEGRPLAVMLVNAPVHELSGILAVVVLVSVTAGPTVLEILAE